MLIDRTSNNQNQHRIWGSLRSSNHLRGRVAGDLGRGSVMFIMQQKKLNPIIKGPEVSVYSYIKLISYHRMQGAMPTERHDESQSVRVLSLRDRLSLSQSRTV